MQHHSGHNSHWEDFEDHDEEEQQQEVVEFDHQTQMRLDAAVDKLLKGYDWTLAPLACK